MTKPEASCLVSARSQDVSQSQKRKDPRFRPLYHETSRTAWNYKKWRFSGQDIEFPVFTKSDNWSIWTKNTDWGERWVAGEERWPNVPTEIRNFRGAVIKMSGRIYMTCIF